MTSVGEEEQQVSLLSSGRFASRVTFNDAEVPAEEDETMRSLHLDGGDMEGLPETPRALRALRPEADLAMAGMESMESRRSARSSGMGKAEKLRLDARWLDMYVANQMKAESETTGSASSHAVNFATLLRQSRPSTRAVALHNSLCKERSSMKSKTTWCFQEVPFKPNQRARVAWDMLGVPLILYDVIMIPLQIAWNDSPPPWLTWLMVAYWLLDILVQFNTAMITPSGTVVTSRAQVTKNYMSLRFGFDLILILLDFTSMLGPSTVRDMLWYRLVRSLRVLRIVRAFRLNRIQGMLETFFLDLGIERLLLMYTVGQTCIAIFLIAHLLSCGWYLLGRLELEAGSHSWLASHLNESTWEAYLHCMYWTLGHIMSGAVNPAIQPTSDEERLYSVFMLASSLLIVGAGISKMTNAIAELQRVHVEANDTRRKLSQVLRASGADADLAGRVLRFGMHLYRRKASLSVEDSVMGLLSKTLTAELTLCQRSKYFVDHPFFARLKQEFPEVYLSICTAFESHIFADSDILFRAGTISECLYITSRGSYNLTTPMQHWGELQHRLIQQTARVSGKTPNWKWDTEIRGEDMITRFDGHRWFCEISVFAKTVHRSELRTTSFADAFTLTGEDLALCVGKSPRCVAAVYQYATEFIHEIEEVEVYQDEECDREILPYDVPQAVCDRLYSAEVVEAPKTNEELDSPAASDQKIGDFFDQVLGSPRGSQIDLPNELPLVFGELHPELGIYAVMKMEGERKRAMAAMLSVIWLVQDDYDSFTASQAQRNKMSPELWQGLQRFVAWAGITRESLHAVLAFLAIRGIGKAPCFLQALPRDEQTPEDVVLTLMQSLPRKVPSYLALEYEGSCLVTKGFEIHRCFNFAQLLQGENTPHHIHVLQNLARQEGAKVLQFYLMSLVGVMCGLRGTETLKGSLFLDRVNASNLLAGIEVLTKLESATPCGIYWGYIAARAARLRLRTDTVEHLALARLACLTRATENDMSVLKKEWARLSRTDRETLMQHFVADGIHNQTLVFTFLPAYLVNARQNRNVGLYRALLVLVELIDSLRSDGYAETIGVAVLEVKLQDLADFTAKAESSKSFMAVHVHSSIVRRRDCLDFLVSAKHKTHTSQQNWCDDPTQEMQALMRRMDRRVGCVSLEIESLQRRRRSSFLEDAA